MNIENRTDRLDGHPGDDLDARQPVLTLCRDTRGSCRFDWHIHRRAQLVYAAAGVITVVTGTGTWAVPPEQAVWVPPETRHEVSSHGPLAMRSLYLHPVAAASLPRVCCVLPVSGLLRELILRVSFQTQNQLRGPQAGRVIRVILDELQHVDPAPLHLPLPSDPRLKTITDKLLLDPGDKRSLSRLSKLAGASTRTVARQFRRETGMSFGQWRQQLRVIRAISLLGEGASVTAVAYDLGYQSPSAFVAMFRRALGAPPGKYFRTGHISAGPGAIRAPA